MTLTTSLTRASVLELEVLISKLLSINGFASTAISESEISTLHTANTSLHAFTRQGKDYIILQLKNKLDHHQT